MLFPHFRLYFHYIRYPLFVLLSKYMTVDHCSPSCLYRQLFANDQAQSTLHQRQSRLDISFISLVNYRVTKQISNRFRTQLYLRTGEISLRADLRSISSLCLLLVMTDTTYYNPQTKQKRDALGAVTYRIRGTAGGGRMNYRGPTSALTADMPVAKLLIHSIVSDNAKWMTIDIKDYYLGTPLIKPDFVCIPTRLLPPSIVCTHNLTPYIVNGSVLLQVSKGMYGLPQACLLAQQRLVTHLASHGYIQTPTPCIFRHTTNGTVFTLFVDEFGIKYTSQPGADHLISTLRQLYEIKFNWVGDSYTGFTIQFDKTAHAWIHR